MGLLIRPADGADLERVRAVALDSKAHWGYDRDAVRRWAEGLAFDSERERWVVEDDGAVVAWAALVAPEHGACVLDHLWVDPASMRRGIGTRLFRSIEERAQALGARSLEWEAEPNAVGFYEKLGGRRLRDQVTAWGRTVPWMGLDL